MTKIVLVRHGHVAWHAPERFRGRADLELSERGRRQARAAALHIAATWRLDAIYTSPLGRCLATAAAIAAPFRLDPQPVAGLADIDYGEWQGLTHEDAQARWPQETALWFSRPHLAAIPGGESLAAVLSRSSTALRDILRRHAEDTIAIVGHDSVNRVLLLFALGLPLSAYWHIGQDACAISEVDFADGEFAIRSLNETQHLAGI
jgi:broad specificity phosphatase PhoE